MIHFSHLIVISKYIFIETKDVYNHYDMSGYSHQFLSKLFLLYTNTEEAHDVRTHKNRRPNKSMVENVQRHAIQLSCRYVIRFNRSRNDGICISLCINKGEQAKK